MIRELSHTTKGWFAVHPFSCCIVYIIVSLTAVISSFVLILDYSVEYVTISQLVIVSVLAVLWAALFTILLIANKANPSMVFVLVAAPCLFAFSMFILPNQVPDEIWHIYRSINLFGDANMVVPYSLSRSNGVPFPDDGYASLRRCIIAAPDWDNSVVINRDMTSYLPHTYIPSGLVMNVCAFIGVNPYIAIIAGRLSNAAAFLIAGYWIIKMSPIGKTLIFVYLVNPMLIQQEASCSADAITNIMGILFVVSVIRCRFNQNNFAHNISLVIVFGIFMCLSKYAYAPILLFALILVPKIKSCAVKKTIFFSAAALVLLVLVYAVFFYKGAYFSSSIDLVRNPPELIRVLCKSVYELGPLWAKEFGGMILGALNINMWEPCFWVYCIVAICALIFNLGETHSFSQIEKIFVVLLTSVTAIAIVLVFREWSISVDNRADVIMGVQGRYFLPFFELPLLCFIGPKSTLVRANCLIYYGITLMLVLLLDIFFVCRAFL